MPEPDAAGGDNQLDVVICTFDNASLLDQALTALAQQRGPRGQWGVLVVDNNSRDNTREVVERHIRLAAIPGLWYVKEQVQGLTQARRRGVAETNAEWIAFVDDDCMLDERWVEQAVAFARAHPDCAGFGGRVVPTYIEAPPAVTARYGWAFAEQDLGDQCVTVDCLVGAGMVVSRSALRQSGWATQPFFADRVGRRLVSGGDVEIALRLAGTGRPLWYTPACRLQHIIPPHRTKMPYLVRMTFALGVSHSLAHALTWRRSRRSWVRAVLHDLVASLASVPKVGVRLGGAPAVREDALLSLSYECGRWMGMARIGALLAVGRCEFFGRDRPDAARSHHAIRAA